MQDTAQAEPDEGWSGGGGTAARFLAKVAAVAGAALFLVRRYKPHLLLRAVWSRHIGIGFPPSPQQMQRFGARALTALLLPVAVLLVRDFSKSHTISDEELKWKRKEADTSLWQLQAAVRSEQHRYEIEAAGGGALGAIRLSVNVDAAMIEEPAGRERFRSELTTLLTAATAKDEAMQSDSEGYTNLSPEQVLVVPEELLPGAGRVARTTVVVLPKVLEPEPAAEAGQAAPPPTSSATSSPEAIASLWAKAVEAEAASVAEEQALAAKGVMLALNRKTAALLGDNTPRTPRTKVDAKKATAQKKKLIARLLAAPVAFERGGEPDSGGGNDFEVALDLHTLSYRRSLLRPGPKITTECGEIPWTEVKKLYSKRKSASLHRYSPKVLHAEASALAVQRGAAAEVSHGDGRAASARGVRLFAHLVRGKVLVPIRLQTELTKLRALEGARIRALRDAVGLSWRGLSREVEESVIKMHNKDHREYEKFRDGNEIKRMLRLVYRVRKRVIRQMLVGEARAEVGLLLFLGRKLNYFGLWKGFGNEARAALAVGPTRAAVVTAIDTRWQKKKKDVGRMGELLKIIRPQLPLMLVSAVLGSVLGSTDGLEQYYKAQVLQAVQDNSRTELGSSFRGLALAQFIIQCLRLLKTRSERITTTAVEVELKRQVSRAIVSQDMSYFELVPDPAAALENCSTLAGTGGGRGYGGGGLVKAPIALLQQVSSVAGMAAVVWKQSPQLLLNMAVVGSVLKVVCPAFIAWARKRIDRQRKGRNINSRGRGGSGTSTFPTSKESMLLCRVYGQEQQALEEYTTQFETNAVISLITASQIQLFQPILDLMQMAGEMFGYWKGAQLALQGFLTSSNLASALTMSRKVVNQVQRIVTHSIPSLGDVIVPAASILDVLNSTPSMGITGGLQLTGQLRGDIEFQGVQFSYPTDKKKVMRDVSFRVDAGSSTGLVGGSGCGKSTVFRLVQRLYDPDHGNVLIDGRNIKEYNPVWLRRQIAFVEQKPVIVAGSIHENLIFGQDPETGRNIPQSDIDAICSKTGVLDFLQSLPEKWNHPASKLSGGQQQMLAISRALLAKPMVLILDEVTSALDPLTQVKMAEAIETLMVGRTVLQIAHRLTVLQNTDRIICFEAGEVAQVGTHRGMLEEEGSLYKKLWDADSKQGAKDGAANDTTAADGTSTKGKNGKGKGKDKLAAPAQTAAAAVESDNDRDGSETSEIFDSSEPSPSAAAAAAMSISWKLVREQAHNLSHEASTAVFELRRLEQLVRQGACVIDDEKLQLLVKALTELSSEVEIHVAAGEEKKRRGSGGGLLENVASFSDVEVQEDGRYCLARTLSRIAQEKGDTALARTLTLDH